MKEKNVMGGGLRAAQTLKDLAWVALLGAILGLVLTAYGCGGEGGSNARGVASPTLPEATIVEPPEGASPQPAAPADASTLTPQITISPAGVVSISNPTGHSVAREVCWFRNGHHPQELLETTSTELGPGESGLWPLPANLCGIELQVDVVKRGRCQLGSANLGHIDAYRYVNVACGETIPPCETELQITYEEGPWSECLPGGGGAGACWRSRTVFEIRQRIDTCTGEVVGYVRRAHSTQREECACPLPPQEVCPFPEAEVLTWHGASSPEEECAAFGPYVLTRDPVFWICKAGNDHEVWSEKPPTGEGATCRNGKEISHATSCGC